MKSRAILLTLGLLLALAGCARYVSHAPSAAMAPGQAKILRFTVTSNVDQFFVQPETLRVHAVDGETTPIIEWRVKGQPVLVRAEEGDCTCTLALRTEITPGHPVRLRVTQPGSCRVSVGPAAGVNVMKSLTTYIIVE